MIDLDISRRTLFVGISVVLALSIVLGITSLGNSSQPDAVTADDINVTAETNARGEDTGVVTIEHTADDGPPIFLYNNGNRRTEVLQPNATLSFDVTTAPAQPYIVRNKTGEALYIVGLNPNTTEENDIFIERQTPE